MPLTGTLTITAGVRWPLLRRTARDQPAHVVGQALDVERRVLHVVADVVGVGLRVLLALLEGAFGAGVRAGVVDRLACSSSSIARLMCFGLGACACREASAPAAARITNEVAASFRFMFMASASERRPVYARSYNAGL